MFFNFYAVYKKIISITLITNISFLNFCAINLLITNIIPSPQKSFKLKIIGINDNRSSISKKFQAVSYILTSQKIAININNKINFLLTDIKNSLLKISGYFHFSSGINYTYNSFGELLFTSTNRENNILQFLYNDKKFDLHTGLQYLKNRFYKSSILRFINADSYDLLNHFNYCDNNPINKIDPNGHAPKKPPLLTKKNIVDNFFDFEEDCFDNILSSVKNLFSGFNVLDDILNIAMLIPLPADLEIDGIISLKIITEEGEFLGGGTFGDAFKYGDFVFKIPKKESMLAKDPRWFDNFLHSANKWNNVMRKIYNGELKNFACAEIIIIDGIEVLRTPFITGVSANKIFRSNWEYILSNFHEQLNIEFEKHGIIMFDNEPRNIIIHSLENGKNIAIPIDFDVIINDPPISPISSFIMQKHLY